jgi:hypothetical protein
MTHDYKRNGTTTLFAALERLQGKVVGPFVWTATVESIVEKLSRCRQTHEKIQPGCTLRRRKKSSKAPND